MHLDDEASPEVGDPYAHLADRFVAHYGTVRGMVRHRLVSEQLDRHLPRPPSSIVDVGGGAGHQAIRLARLGYDVTLVDPSERMLSEARERLDGEPSEVRARVRLVHASAEASGDAVEGRSFDAVCCHAVLPYVEQPGVVLDALVGLAAPGGVVSVLFKNADSLPVRAALEGRWEESLELFDADRDRGGLGAVTRAHELDEVVAMLESRGMPVEAWYGVRVLSDHRHDAPVEDLERILAVEREAAQRDPYRRLGRLIHVIGRRR